MRATPGPLGRIFWLLVVSFAVACASNNSSAESEILAQEERFFEAVAAKGEGLDKLLAEEFFYNTLKGSQLTGAQLRTYLAGSSLEVLSFNRHCQTTQLAGTAAVVTGITESLVREEAGVARGFSRYLHVWQKEQGAWKLAARQVTAAQDRVGSNPCD